jgi:hypothetical protein
LAIWCKIIGANDKNDQNKRTGETFARLFSCTFLEAQKKVTSLLTNAAAIPRQSFLARELL